MSDWADCECGRGAYDPEDYSSCYNCYLDRRAEYVTCIFCDRWHSPAFDTCFECRPGGRDEAAVDLKRVILGRDSFACRYCGATEGDLQEDPRLIRLKCPPGCATQHNHRHACELGCGRNHRHRGPGDPGTCQPSCTRLHEHLAKDDDGIRPARLHIDHIRPCKWHGTADPWNLQTLCGVCNIAKGGEWWAGSRHDHARQSIVAAYMTYLHEYLSVDEDRRLRAELDAEGLGWDLAEARRIVVQDYRRLVGAARLAREAQQ